MNTGSSVTLDGSGSSLAGASDALASPAFAIPPSFAAPRIESSLSLPSLRSRQHPLFDQSVLGLAGKIEELIDTHNLFDSKAGRVLEVEGRIGILRENDTGDRIRLPVDAEVLLESSNSLFNYRFDAGTTAETFSRLTDAIRSRLGVELDDAGRVDANAKVYQRDPIMISNTNDYFVDLSECAFDRLGIPQSSGDVSEGRRVRVSYPVPSDHDGPAKQPMLQRPSEIIWKDRLCVFDFYSGRNKEEMAFDSQDTHQVLDIRIAINIEYQLPLHLEVPRPLMMRRRHRISYPLKNRFRIDTTKVVERADTNPASSYQGKETYEIEVEMNPTVLLRAAKEKMEGNPDFLYHLIKNFFGILRGIARFPAQSTDTRLVKLAADSSEQPTSGVFYSSENTTTSSLKTTRPLIDLRGNTQPPEVLDTYLSYLSPVVPLIGDYLYRAVAPMRERAAKAACLENASVNNAS